MERARITAADLRSRKGRGGIVALTAYTAPFARLLDPHVDILLVGDSLGMVLYGMESTLAVTLPMMIMHGAAVVRASARALVAVDMPFGSYQESPVQAFAACAKVMAATGCGAVKLEGGMEMAETIRFLVERGVPVMGHVGMKPQHLHVQHGYRAVGRTEAERERIRRDAVAVEKAGAFAVVAEAMEEELAEELTKTLTVPVIGIGASRECDGQVLVTEDMAGLTARTPRFVKSYGALGEMLSRAAEAYAAEVRAGRFPAAEHIYRFKKD